MSTISASPIVLALTCLAVALAGCDPTTTPVSFEKAPDSGTSSRANGAAREVVFGSPAAPADRASKGRPFGGKLRTLDVAWFVSHFAEEGCAGGLVAGAEVDGVGNVKHMGKTSASASAAWDWGTAAAGAHAPEGPTTGSSATVLDTYPHDFCSAERSSSGRVVLVAANGDEVHGAIVGGEVYELGFIVAGDGQEQFVEVEIDGGTGRFSAASGSFVLHTVVHLVGQNLMLGEILDSGLISY